MKKNSNLIDEARNINSSLVRTKLQLQASVLVAEGAKETVIGDGEHIEQSLEEHKYTLKAALSSTGRSLRKLKFIQFAEKYSLYLSLAVYFFVVTYVLLKRLGVLRLIYRQLC